MIFGRLPVLWLVLTMTANLAAAAGQPDAPRQKRTPVYTEQGTKDCLRCHWGRKCMRSPQAPTEMSSAPVHPPPDTVVSPVTAPEAFTSPGRTAAADSRR